MNFTASFLNFKEDEITDELGHPIETLKPIKRKYSFCFDKPKMHFDIIDGSQKEPEFKDIRSIPTLADLGIVLHTVPIRKEEQWFPNQRKRLRIFLRDSIQKEGRELASMPSSMYCLYDSANGLIKLIGPFAGPNGEGEWLRL